MIPKTSRMASPGCASGSHYSHLCPLNRLKKDQKKALCFVDYITESNVRWSLNEGCQVTRGIHLLIGFPFASISSPFPSTFCRVPPLLSHGLIYDNSAGSDYDSSHSASARSPVRKYINLVLLTPAASFQPLVDIANDLSSNTTTTSSPVSSPSPFISTSSYLSSSLDPRAAMDVPLIDRLYRGAPRLA